MIDAGYTGLNNPYGAYKQFVWLIYLGGLVVMKGNQEPYTDRTARRLHCAGISLISNVKYDINMKAEHRRLIADLRELVHYLQACQELDHALPGFKAACGGAKCEATALIQSLDGGWSERMYPMLVSPK